MPGEGVISTVGILVVEKTPSVSLLDEGVGRAPGVLQPINIAAASAANHTRWNQQAMIGYFLRL